VKYFNKKYPEMGTFNDEVEDSSMTIIRGRRYYKCTECGHYTQYVSMDFETSICSDTCAKKLSEAYVKATVKATSR